MSARGARKRPALTAAPFHPDVGPDIELDRAAAAVWLLDQVHYGELCFLTMREDPKLPSWVSAPAVEGMRPSDVTDWLQEMAMETLASALGAARKTTQREAALAEARRIARKHRAARRGATVRCGTPATPGRRR